MPASVAHMLIARKVRKSLPPKAVPAGFVEMLEKNARYMELGSLGPDLPYYAIRGRSPHDLPEEEVADPPEWTWGDLLHAKKPNSLPLEMIEAIWRGSEGDWRDRDKMTLAFACGYLTHIAADQVVHPYVNGIAGDYNASYENKRTHREVEVYQDVVLYATVVGGDLMKARPRPSAWCDLKQRRGKETKGWFPSTLRAAFNKAYEDAPADRDIERWVKHLLYFLGLPKVLRMYPRAAGDYNRHGDNSPMVQKAFTAIGDIDDIGYMGACFEPAAKLGAMYVMAAAKLYALDRWEDRYRDAFLGVVSPADLGNPKPEVDLEQVSDALSKWPTAAGEKTGEVRRKRPEKTPEKTRRKADKTGQVRIRKNRQER